MRPFLIRFGVFAAIQMLLLLAVLWSYQRQYPPEQNYLAAFKDKQRLIRGQASPRLILIGGSSMAFGVKSAEIAQACGRHPVNMGLHAGVGLKFMLAEVESWLREGDWVIVAPEYEHFGRLSGTSDILLDILEIDYRQARYLSRGDLIELFEDGIVRSFGKKARLVLRRPWRAFQRNAFAHMPAYYKRVGFNSDGDVVAHLGLASPGITDMKFRLPRDPDEVRKTVECLNRFMEVAAGRGARAWFSHPPIPMPLFETNEEPFRRFEAVLAQSLRMPQLDRVKNMVFPYTYFFDTWYHLSRRGVEERTRILSERMKAQAESASDSLRAGAQRVGKGSKRISSAKANAAGDGFGPCARKNFTANRMQT